MQGCAAAQELFIESLSHQAKGTLLRSGGTRKTVLYSDVSMAVKQHDELEFLADIIPPQVDAGAVDRLKRKFGEHTTKGRAADAPLAAAAAAEGADASDAAPAKPAPPADPPSATSAAAAPAAHAQEAVPVEGPTIASYFKRG